METRHRFWLLVLTRFNICIDIRVLRLNYVPSNARVEVSTLVPQKVTLFAHKVLTEVTKLKWGHEALIQYDWHPYRKGAFGHGDRYTEDPR